MNSYRKNSVLIRQLGPMLELVVRLVYVRPVYLFPEVP